MNMTTVRTRQAPVFAGADDSNAMGILSEGECRRMLAYERALSDRHERTFALLVFSSSEERRVARFNAQLIELLKRRLRETDVVGWAEGGHVAVILPQSNTEGARILADALCEELTACALTARCELHTYPGDEPPSVDRRDGAGGSGGLTSVPRVQAARAPAGTGSRPARMPGQPAAAPAVSPCAGDPRRLMALITRPLPHYKRLLDIGLALIGIALVSPLMAAVAALIKCVSAGPVLFKQERVGHLGAPFLCWKFRTMTVAADTGVHREYLSGLMQKDVPLTKLDAGNDARLIPCGKLLRASGVDELPQLFNVLRGEMSIVGPRPCIPYECRAFQRWHKRRFDTLPGLTGLWQVSGKNRTTFSQMMRLDVAYSRAPSLRRDLRIVWRTLPVLIEQVQGMLEQRSRKRMPAHCAAESVGRGAVGLRPIAGVGRTG